MNKGIEVTRENFKDVASRLFKFSRHNSFVSWYNFDCGTKKRVRRFLKTRFGEKIDTLEEVSMFKVPRSGPFRILFAGNRRFKSVNLSVGDIVWFLGNRVVFRIKNPSNTSSNRYLYLCIQIGELSNFS